MSSDLHEGSVADDSALGAKTQDTAERLWGMGRLFEAIGSFAIGRADGVIGNRLKGRSEGFSLG